MIKYKYLYNTLFIFCRCPFTVSLRSVMDLHFSPMFYCCLKYLYLNIIYTKLFVNICCVLCFCHEFHFSVLTSRLGFRWFRLEDLPGPFMVGKKQWSNFTVVCGAMEPRLSEMWWAFIMELCRCGAKPGIFFRDVLDTTTYSNRVEKTKNVHVPIHTSRAWKRERELPIIFLPAVKPFLSSFGCESYVVFYHSCKNHTATNRQLIRKNFCPCLILI